MEPKAELFTSAVNSTAEVRMPIAAAVEQTLPKVFPWLASSHEVARGPLPLDDQFALFADEARAWAELTWMAAAEDWPDDWSDD